MRIESLQGDYVGLFEALTDGVLITEAATGRFSYVNAAAARLLGFESRQKVLGADPREVGARFLLTDPDGQPIDPETLPNRLALKGQHPAPMAIRCVLASGERRWATLSAVPVRDDQGHVVRAVTIFHDTTEQERIARDTRFLADASAALTDALDLPTTVRTLARLCVPTLADWCVVALGKDIQGSEIAAVHADPSKAVAVLALWHALAQGEESLPARALRSGGPLEVEALTPELLSPAAARDEGTGLLAELEPRGCVVVPLVARGRSLGSLALFDNAGSPRTGERLALAKELGQRAALALDNARLITELQHAEVRLNLAMQSGGVGYYEVDLITRRVTLSPSYQVILGMAPGSFDGTYEGFIQYIHPEDRARMVAHNKAIIEGSAADSSTFRILRPDGQVRWVEGTTRIVRDVGGRPLRALGMRVDVTGRQEAEARLRTSEERLRLALDAGRFGYIDQDLQGGTSIASPRMAEILGFPMGSYEYNLDTWQQRIHPQDRDWVLDNFRRMLEQGETTAFTYRLRWPDGQLRWIDSHVWVMRDARGQPVRLLAVSQDVTTQKLNEEQARKLLTEQAARREADAGRQRIIAILDSITEPLFALDWSGRVRFTNLPAEQLLGRTREELIGRVAREEPLFTQAPALADCCDEAVREKRMVERQVQLPDGRRYEVRARPFDAGVSLYLHDVTALKREQETQTRLARHDALRADVSTELSGQGKLGEVLQRCAEAVLRHLGVTQARIWTLSAEEGVLELQASAGRAAGQEGPARLPAASLLPVGEPRPRPFLTNAAADHLDTLRQEGGGGEGLTAYARFPLLMGEQCLGLLTLGAEAPLPEDVRPALSAVADALAQAIVRRRAEQSLAEYAEELVRSNSELEQFAYVASHDLQEPLRMVASFTELLARRYQGKLDEKADRYIGFAIDGVTRMQRLIQDLLEFSRVGTKVKQFAPTDTQVVFQRALSNLRAAVADASAEVTADPLPRVLADEVQLEQLLQNLVGNALKFRAPGNPARVHLSARREGEQWTFSVRDHGIGIEPQYFERIFAIFQRLHGKQKYPGTGIGLAICKKIVERHGGRIWVESTPGQGSTFSFTLSALPASDGAASSPEHPES